LNSPLPLSPPLHEEGVAQSCFDFVAVHMDVSCWNSTNGFRRLKSAATKTEILTHPRNGEGDDKGVS